MILEEPSYSPPETDCLELNAISSFVTSYGDPGDPGTVIGEDGGNYDF